MNVLKAHHKPLSKLLLRWLFGDYQIYRIYKYNLDNIVKQDVSYLTTQGYRFTEVNSAEVAAASDQGIQSRAIYGGKDALGFAIFFGDQIVCIQWYWYSERYKTRNFWPLLPGQAKSVDIYTVPGHRGKALATALKTESARLMKEKGFLRLFSRIWHSHHESIKVSEKAGWNQIAIVAEFYPLGLSRKFRIVFPFKP